MSLNFNERSAGFVWFFSFLAFFSEYRYSTKRLVILLDEPGLGLHASAQADLLRFIDEKLAEKHQIIYTTHSPFMVKPTDLDRARTVEDVIGEGTKISSEVLTTTKDTVFPLQAAIGYELSQTLFVGPNNLVVEGPSDILYLQIISQHLVSQGRQGLDDKWVIVPVGGSEKIPTFLALLGTQLNVAVLLDVSSSGNQKVDDLVNRGILETGKIFPLNKFTGLKEADIEDMFVPSFYLQLLKGSEVGNFKVGDLQQGARIVQRIEKTLGHTYNHYAPSAYFLHEQATLLSRVADSTLDRFETLFVDINNALQ
jgi:predicted ATP-dependent endonuclease of OLD family